jgi:hypothetical protein
MGASALAALAIRHSRSITHRRERCVAQRGEEN